MAGKDTDSQPFMACRMKNRAVRHQMFDIFTYCHMYPYRIKLDYILCEKIDLLQMNAVFFPVNPRQEIAMLDVVRDYFWRQFLLHSHDAREVLLFYLLAFEKTGIQSFEHIALESRDQAVRDKIYAHIAKEREHAALFERHLPRRYEAAIDVDIPTQYFVELLSHLPEQISDSARFFLFHAIAEKRGYDAVIFLERVLSETDPLVPGLKKLIQEERDHVFQSDESRFRDNQYETLEKLFALQAELHLSWMLWKKFWHPYFFLSSLLWGVLFTLRFIYCKIFLRQQIHFWPLNRIDVRYLIKVQWWCFLGTFITSKGSKMSVLLYVAKHVFEETQKLFGIHRFIATITEKPVVLAHLSIVDHKHKKSIIFEEVSPHVLFVGDETGNSYNYQLGNWKSEDRGDQVQLSLKTADSAMRLTLLPQKPTAVMFEDLPHLRHLDPFSEGRVHTNIAVEGSIERAGIKEEIISGSAWYERAWSRIIPWHFLVTNYTWAIFVFHDNTCLMTSIACPQGASGVDGFFVDQKGISTMLRREDFLLVPRVFWRSLKTGVTYPVEWDLSSSLLHIFVRIKASFPEQEFDGCKLISARHWFGIAEATGERDTIPISGEVYFGTSRRQRLFVRVLVRLGRVWHFCFSPKSNLL